MKPPVYVRGRNFLKRVRKMADVVRDFKAIQRDSAGRFAVRWSDRWMHLRDATSTTGFDRHYVFHTAWAARVLSKTKPAAHVDVASSLYFVTSVSAFVPVTFIDYRPAHLGLSGVESREGSLMRLPYDDRSVESLSCMHVIEHVGLGRYGDPIDAEGDLKSARELVRILAPGGWLMMVMPVGGEARIQFNAHRIYTYDQVVAMFDDLELQEFALIPDDGSPDGLIVDADPELVKAQRYGCGCFLFRKALAS